MIVRADSFPLVLLEPISTKVSASGSTATVHAAYGRLSKQTCGATHVLASLPQLVTQRAQTPPGAHFVSL